MVLRTGWVRHEAHSRALKDTAQGDGSRHRAPLGSCRAWLHNQERGKLPGGPILGEREMPVQRRKPKDAIRISISWKCRAFKPNG